MTVPGESTAPSKLYVFYLQHQLRESVKGSMRRNKANKISEKNSYKFTSNFLRDFFN